MHSCLASWGDRRVNPLKGDPRMWGSQGGEIGWTWDKGTPELFREDLHPALKAQRAHQRPPLSRTRERLQLLKALGRGTEKGAHSNRNRSIGVPSHEGGKAGTTSEPADESVPRPRHSARISSSDAGGLFEK